MKDYDLPERWQTKLQEYIAAKNSPYNDLGAGDFPPDKALKLKFPDGSTAAFKYAMILELPAYHEIAVFTEHCGHHIFPSYRLELEWVNLN